MNHLYFCLICLLISAVSLLSLLFFVAGDGGIKLQTGITWGMFYLVHIVSLAVGIVSFYRYRSAQREKVKFMHLREIVQTAVPDIYTPDTYQSHNADPLLELASEVVNKFGEERSQLHMQVEAFEQIVENIQDAVVVLSEDGLVTNLNETAMQLFESDREHVSGSPLSELTRAKELLEFVSTLSGAQSESPICNEMRIGGDEQLYDVSATPLNSGTSEVFSWLLVLRNVTTQRRLERLRKSFVTNVSHELKTPITSIKLAAETLADGALQDTENAGGFLDIIVKHSDRLGELADDLLQLAKIEEIDDANQLRLVEVSVQPFLTRIADAFSTLLTDKGQSITISADDTLVAEIDPYLAEQAIANVASNAIKYCGEGANITIDARHQEAFFVITISDDGPGISQKHLSRLFERFYRVDEGRNRADGGTGLGLAIVKHVCQAHQGDAVVDSQVGQGTNFTLRFRQIWS